MAETAKKKSRRARKKAVEEEDAARAGTIVLELDPQLRAKMQDLMSELIFDAQEIGFVLAELECEKRSECALVKKTKQLVKRIRELFELQREISASRRAARQAPATVYA